MAWCIQARPGTPSTGEATLSTSYWTRPAEATDGLLEHYVPLDGPTGPIVSNSIPLGSRCRPPHPGT